MSPLESDRRLALRRPFRVRGLASEFLIVRGPAAGWAEQPLCRPFRVQRAIASLRADDPFAAELVRGLFQAATGVHSLPGPREMTWTEKIQTVSQALADGRLWGVERFFQPPRLRGSLPRVEEQPEPEQAPAPPPSRSTLSIAVVDETGAPVEGAEVGLGATNLGGTKKDGLQVKNDLAGGVHEIEVLKTGYTQGKVKVTVADGSSSRVKVQLTKLRAKLVFPAHKADHKQFVNLKAAAAEPEAANRQKIRFEVPHAKAGDKAYLKLEFDKAKVSKRNSPARAVVGGLTADWCPQGGKELTLKAEGEQLEVELELGLAGGDVYTVSIGSTNHCEDQACKVITWRKLWYEVMAPELMGLKNDLSGGHRARVKALMDPCFIDYQVWKTHAFPEAAAPAGTIFDPAYFEQKGRKRFVLTDHTFTQYPSANGAWDKGKQPRSVGLRLCDKNYFNDQGNEQIVTLATQKKSVVNVWNLKQRWMMPTSANSGVHAIKEIKWVAKIDPVAHPKHPAVLAGAARSGTLDVVKDVQFLSIKKLQIQLPDGTVAAPGPGAWVGAKVTEKGCPIELRVKFEAADEGLGLSGQGAQSGENLVCYLDAAPQTTVDVMIHELCHSAGMAVIGAKAPPPGVPQPKTTSQADPDNQDKGSTLGHLYSGHGHSGGHCARGLSDAQKGLPSYGGLAATCINFGENSLVDPSARSEKICATCAEILKARELQAI